MAEPPAFIGLAGRHDEFRIFHPIRTNSRYEDTLRCQFHGQCPAVAQEKGFRRRVDSQFRNGQEGCAGTNLDQMTAGMTIRQYSMDQADSGPVVEVDHVFQDACRNGRHRPHLAKAGGMDQITDRDLAGR